MWNINIITVLVLFVSLVFCIVCLDTLVLTAWSMALALWHGPLSSGLHSFNLSEKHDIYNSIQNPSRTSHREQNKVHLFLHWSSTTAASVFLLNIFQKNIFQTQALLANTTANILTQTDYLATRITALESSMPVVVLTAPAYSITVMW